MATELHFKMTISPEEAQRYYSGSARSVMVKAETGERIQFPAEHIRPFIDQQGVNGYFSIRFDKHNRLIAIKRL